MLCLVGSWANGGEEDFSIGWLSERRTELLLWRGDYGAVFIDGFCSFSYLIIIFRSVEDGGGVCVTVTTAPCFIAD